MTAKKKSSRSSRSSKSSYDSSGFFQLLFQVLVIVAIGWFIYSGYTQKHSVKSDKTKSIAVKTEKVQPRAKSVEPSKPAAERSSPAVVVSPDNDVDSDEITHDMEVARAKINALKADVARERSEQSASTQIAMTSRPKKTFSKNKRKPKIVFVIDDIGHTNEFQSLLFTLDDDITYSILPDLKYSLYFDKISAKTGADVILHLPLETQSGRYPGPGLIESKMSDEEVLQMLRHNFKSTPHFIGSNNHMGSLGSMDRRLMRIILGEFKRQNKFFLDSYTTSDSVIVDVGRELGMTVYRRDVFLDNTDEQSYIRRQIKQLADAAYKKGYAVGIGHYRYNTLKVISEEIPRLEESGYEIIPLSELYRQGK